MTGAFACLQQNYHCEYAFSRDLSDSSHLVDANLVHNYGYTTTEKAKHTHFYYCQMWQARGKSKTFRYRYKRWLGIDRITRFAMELRKRLQGKRSELTVAQVVKLPFSVAWNVIVRERAWPLLIPLLSAVYSKGLTRWLLPPSSAQLDKIVLEASPDLIIMPSNAYNPECLDVVRAAEKVGAKTLFLIDNWDNLSSKSVFYHRPDFLAVWGEQSRAHAVNIHGFRKEQVSIIGTPRFDIYQGEGGDRPFPFHYALFTGCFLHFDEVECLELLEAEMVRAGDFYKDLRIVYRPHPWREKRFNEKRILDMKRVVVDPQLKTSVLSGRVDTGFQPQLGYYPRLIKHAEFIMGPLTTMLIEGAICGRNILAIAYHDGSFTSPWMAYQHYEHFIGLADIRGIKICTDRSSLATQFRQTFETCDQRLDVMDNQLSDIIAHGQAKPYSERLLSVVRSVLGQTSAPLNFGNQETSSTANHLANKLI